MAYGFNSDKSKAQFAKQWKNITPTSEVVTTPPPILKYCIELDGTVTLAIKVSLKDMDFDKGVILKLASTPEAIRPKGNASKRSLGVYRTYNGKSFELYVAQSYICLIAFPREPIYAGDSASVEACYNPTW